MSYNETKKLTSQNLVRSVGSLVRTSPLNNSDLQTNLSNYTSDNIRELEGVINHLSISLMQGKEITLNLAKEALKHYQRLMRIF